MSITINAKLKRETDKAILVEYEGEDIWLPKSQVTTFPATLNIPGEIEMSDWIAEQKNITMDASERYIVEPSSNNPTSWAIKDTSTNPVHIMCRCGTQRDAEIIAASLEMTKNKI